MKSLRIVFFVMMAAAAVWAQPSISLVENAASNIAPGLPNAAVAQGAMFVLKGAGMGPANVVVATSFPLSTTIAGTSVRVVVGGQTKDCIMYYSLDRQVAAILPSSTPVGTGTVTVTYNGQTSATAPITVVANNIAMYTLDSSGTGPAVATFSDSFVSPTNAARASDIVILWTNGLGPVSSDETKPAVQADQPNVPLEVYIGGKQADILFRGRNNCCSSVDTIYVRVPAGVAGCVTPVTMKIGNVVSNTASIPVAASGRTCTPTTPGFSDSDFQRLLGKGTVSVGGISLIRSVTTTAGFGGVGGGTTRTDTGGGSFVKFNLGGSTGIASGFDVATYGSCTVSTFTGQTIAPTTNYQFLDAGPAINITGPAGAKTLTKQSAAGTILYGGTIGTGTPGNYLDPGQYTITGVGGADVGSFTANLTVPAQLTWTNQAAITAVNRANGVNVTWTGGDPAGYVQISGTSVAATNANDAVGASFTCTARTGDGSFTVPAIVLLSLPASVSIQGFTIPGTLSVSSYSASTQFQATGLDFGSVSNTTINSNSVNYQ